MTYTRNYNNFFIIGLFFDIVVYNYNIFTFVKGAFYGFMGEEVNNEIKAEVVKIDSDKILEKYLDYDISERRKSEERIATYISDLKKELREDRKDLEQRLSKHMTDIEERLLKSYDANQVTIKEINSKLNDVSAKITETSIITIRWVVGLVIGAILSLLGISITVILRILNP